MDWDETLSSEQVSLWNKWIANAELLETITVKRCVKPLEADIVSIQLQVFCAASLVGYGAVT